MVFSNESSLYIRWPKYWSFSFIISPSKEYSGLISFRMDWLDLLAVQGTLKSRLCGRGRGWDDLGEWHWNMYNIIYETSHQPRFNAQYWMLGAGALERPRGMVRGGRREEGSGWGTHVYLWWIHVDIWQNQYNIIKLKNKIKWKKKWKKKKRHKKIRKMPCLQCRK